MLLAGGAYATLEPVRHRADPGGTRGVGRQGAQVHVTVSGRDPREDRAPRRAGVVQ